MAIDFTYPMILDQFGPHLIEGRVESRAFLGWFLENYYRLEQSEAQDCICDGPDDKGIDGIFVDSTQESIELFQTKLYKSDTKTLGDSALKHFVGSMDQMRTAEGARKLARETGNLELRELILTEKLPEKIAAGYSIHGRFITNVEKDSNAERYEAGRDDLLVLDSIYLDSNWVPPGDSSPVSGKIAFQLDGHAIIESRTKDATVYVASLLATELVRLEGIQSGELFSWNVRKALGKTKVNKAIASSVKDQEEHKNFFLFHNGLTILAESVATHNDALELDGYTVVNGCQSLSTLFENKHLITDEIRLLARIVKISPSSELGAKITRNSNNQNSITARDLQSNSALQRRLRSEFETMFAGAIEYEIKRGESSHATKVITNEDAARALLAFDREQPWSCHQSYRLFDELHSDIFARPEVNAGRIAALVTVHDAITRSLEGIENKLVSSYRLTQYFLMYLTRAALEVDDRGQDFIRDPGLFIDTIGLAGIEIAVSNVAQDIITDFNAEIDEREQAENPFDYKRELKSATSSRALKNAIIPSYKKAIRRNRATAFSDEVAALVSKDA